MAQSRDLRRQMLDPHVDENTASSLIAFHRAELARRQYLLKRSWRLVIGPLLLGLLVFTDCLTSDNLSHSAAPFVLCAITAVMRVAMAIQNRRQAKILQRDIDDLKRAATHQAPRQEGCSEPPFTCSERSSAGGDQLPTLTHINSTCEVTKMRTRQAKWLAVLLSLAAAGATQAATKSVEADPTPNSQRAPDIIGALAAAGPHASLGDQAKVLEQLVGTWDVEYKDILKDGREQHRSGQFIVAWVLDGRAIEDVWIVEPSEGRQEREVYADIRYFDPKTHSWPTVFIDPEHASTAKFTGGATQDGRMVLQTSDLGRPQNRWSFTANGPDSFVFRDEYSSDGGETWKTLSEDHMKRHHPDAPR